MLEMIRRIFKIAGRSRQKIIVGITFNILKSFFNGFMMFGVFWILLHLENLTPILKERGTRNKPWKHIVGDQSICPCRFRAYRRFIFRHTCRLPSKGSLLLAPNAPSLIIGSNRFY